MAIPSFSQPIIGIAVQSQDGAIIGTIIDASSHEIIFECGIFIKYLSSFRGSDITAITPSFVQISRPSSDMKRSWNIVTTFSGGRDRSVIQVGVLPFASYPVAEPSVEE